MLKVRNYRNGKTEELNEKEKLSVPEWLTLVGLLTIAVVAILTAIF